MKSAYELAMERLAKNSPSVSLTGQQKKKIAELESKYKAKIAERELALRDEMAKFAAQGDFAKIEELEQQLVNERKKLMVDLEEKKASVRTPKG